MRPPACWRCDQIRAAIRDDKVLSPMTSEFQEVIAEFHQRKHAPLEAVPCPVVLYGVAVDGMVQTRVSRPCLKLKGHEGDHVAAVKWGYKHFPKDTP